MPEEHTALSFSRPVYGEQDWGTSMMNEMVKSYGLRHDPASGMWSWSLENIGKSFQEDPVWTTIDYLLLGAPVAKWGSAAAKVGQGVGAPGKGYAAGRFKGARPKGEGFVTRLAENVLGSEKAAAAEMLMEGGPRSRFMQKLSSPITQRFSEDYTKLMHEMGGPDAAELRSIFHIAQREKRASIGYHERVAEELIRSTGRVFKTDAEKRTFVEALEGGLDLRRGETNPFGGKYSEERFGRFDPQRSQAQRDELVRKLGTQGAAEVEKTWHYRNAIHEQAFDLGLISEQTYVANLKRYSPRLYEEYTYARGQVIDGKHRFKARTTFEPAEGMERIFEPALTIEGLGKAGEVIAFQSYAQGLARSVAARTPREVAERVGEALNNGDPKLLQLYGVIDDITKQRVSRFFRRADIDGQLSDGDAEAVARLTGWKSIEDLYRDKGAAIPGYISRLPDELRNKWLDPAIQSDFQGLIRMADDGGFMRDFYNNSMGFFRASKTAYNPATWVRNAFGALVSSSNTQGLGELPRMLATGFGKGRKVWFEGLDSQEFLEAAQATIVGGSHDVEIRELMRSAGINGTKPVTAMDFLGNSTIAKMIQGKAGQAERLYRAIDEIAKLDSFVTRRDYWLKQGLNRQDALSRAALDVNKFTPTFAQNSEFTNQVRKAIPFASFVTESVRTWKNVMQEAPHRAFFWNHMADVMGKTFGAMSGMSQDEIEAAEQSLPHYQQGKKMMLFPFKVDGKPVFLDMSYLIPMANISEAQGAEATFFDMLQIDPTANPFLNMTAAIATGKDPFSKRDIEPRFTERQLGVPVNSPQARTVVGLVEHMAALMLPPLAPPGYTGVNLLEYARGQKHPNTGQPLEQGMVRTLASNLAGMRLYEADVNSQLLNARHEERLINERVASWWKRWEYAKANGDIAAMDRAQSHIIAQRDMLRGDGEAYFLKSSKRHEPGKFRGVSTRQLTETVERARRIGHKDKADLEMLGELNKRLTERKMGGGG